MLYLLSVEFEVLVILHGAPGTAPGKAVLQKEAVEEVALYDLITILFAPVDIGTARSGLYDLRAVLGVTNVRIIKGVDIDGEATGMIGEILGAGDGTIAETTGVVVWIKKNGGDYCVITKKSVTLWPH